MTEFSKSNICFTRSNFCVCESVKKLEVTSVVSGISVVRGKWWEVREYSFYSNPIYPSLSQSIPIYPSLSPKLKKLKNLKTQKLFLSLQLPMFDVPFLDGFLDELGHVWGIQFAHDAAAVKFDGVHRHIESLGYLLWGDTFTYKL